ncbi:winged helix-turn-helix transcriptional regulator [Halovenus halobia]|uniref:winged helix-turn-helix transcriptional regulator n=1 Tax=Halovenus halobia TaxID=3396622 RepID=UPI003F563A2E
MAADETPDDDSSAEPATEGESSGDVREKFEAEADRAIEQFDEGVVDLLSWILETETRARIYIYLRQHPDSTSEEIADGTGLYPSTVREALAALNDDGTVERGKRESDGAGNNPYEYSAMAPSELIGGVIDDVQGHMNAVFNLDKYLNGDEKTDEPVTITVTDEDDE